jgi:hypothetical protein
LVLVRSAWLAWVEVGDWEPEHEIKYRQLFEPEAALIEMAQYDQGTHPALLRRFFHEALSAARRSQQR